MRTRTICVRTKGNTDIIDITPRLNELVREKDLDDGVIFLSVKGSTAGITTMEFEPGLAKDLRDTFQKLFPYRADYAHNARWNDDNGHSHLRSSLLKTNFFVSVTGGVLDLGTWQQLVLLDFDTRERDREIVIKILSS